MNEHTRTPASNLDPQKRETLRKLFIGSAYAVPVIASFSMSEVNLLRAESYSHNSATECKLFGINCD